MNISTDKVEFKNTPVGIMEWPYLDIPDTKWGFPGHYKSELRLYGFDAAELRREIDEKLAVGKRREREEATAEGRPANTTVCPLPYRTRQDGSTIFYLKSTRRPDVVDSQNNPVTAKVGHGSTGLFRYSINQFSGEFGVGVSLKMVAVQVLKLVPFGRPGFPVVKNAYVANADAEPQLENRGTDSRTSEATDKGIDSGRGDDDIPF